jgi:hypothetical protein
MPEYASIKDLKVVIDQAAAQASPMTSMTVGAVQILREGSDLELMELLVRLQYLSRLCEKALVQRGIHPPRSL